MNRPVPEQLTLDGRSVPHEQVVKDTESAERSKLGRLWRETQDAINKATRKEKR